jgi:hypothetical protein
MTALATTITEYVIYMQMQNPTNSDCWLRNNVIHTVGLLLLSDVDHGKDRHRECDCSFYKSPVKSPTEFSFMTSKTQIKFETFLIQLNLVTGWDQKLTVTLTYQPKTCSLTLVLFREVLKTVQIISKAASSDIQTVKYKYVNRIISPHDTNNKAVYTSTE